MKKKTVLFETFATEYIEITTDLKVMHGISHDGESGEPIGVEMPLAIRGFLMDADDIFVYLSQDGEEINQALPLESIKHIQVIEPEREKNELEELLELVPAPDDDKGYN